MRFTIEPPNLDFSGLLRDGPGAVAGAHAKVVGMIAEDAKRSIAEGGKSGSIGERHQASAPGEAPAFDSGNLMAAFVVSDDYNALARTWKAEVKVSVKYARYLEYGTRFMRPRPFLFPAVERNKPKITELPPFALEGELSLWAREFHGGERLPSGAFPGSEVTSEAEARYWAFRFRE